MVLVYESRHPQEAAYQVGSQVVHDLRVLPAAVTAEVKLAAEDGGEDIELLGVPQGRELVRASAPRAPEARHPFEIQRGAGRAPTSAR